MDAQPRYRSHVENRAPGGLRARRQLTSPALALRRRSALAAAGTILGSAPGMLLPFAIVAVLDNADETDRYFLLVAISTFLVALFGNTAAGVMAPMVVQAREAFGRSGVETWLRTRLPSVA